MKRLASVFGAAVLVLALPAGAATAGYFGVLDQSNSVNLGYTAGAEGILLAQTFTAGRTGILTHVELYMESQTTTPDALSIMATTSKGLPTGSALGSSSAVPVASPGGWLTFYLSPQVPVTSGVMYAIVFQADNGSVVFAGTAYADGQALIDEPWTSYQQAFGGEGAADFAFRTYVLAQSTTLQWNAGQVLAGASTAMTLTETFTFPPDVAPVVRMNAPANPGYFVAHLALPAWFTPTSVVCSSQIAAADCVLAKIAVGQIMNVTPDGSPVTVTIGGTAAPAGAAAGTTGTATAEGCVALAVNVTPAQVGAMCVSGSANVAVVTTLGTPPPTSTGSQPSRELGSVTWLMPVVLLAMLGGALAFARRGSSILR